MTAPFTSFPIPTVLLAAATSSSLGIVQVDGVTIVAVAGVITAVRSQRAIVGVGGLPITASDQILNINTGSDITPVVPLASTRSGVPLTFKNLPSSHLQTITRTAPDTIDGVSTYVLAAGASLTLLPYNDGVNSGYGVL